MNNNNNNTDDNDEDRYDSYADKYFCEQPDNEIIHTLPSSQPIIIQEFTELDIFQKFFEEYDSKLTKLAKEMNERQKQINEFKKIRNQLRNNLTTLKTQMRNLSNKNNNNNIDLNIINQIKNIEKQIHNLTNDIEKSEYKQNTLERICRKALIEDRQNFIETQKNSYSLYNKMVLENPEKRKLYEKLKRKTSDSICSAKHYISNSEKILLTLPILVPKKKYEINDGILGAIRDINMKLITRLKNERDMRQFAGISGEYSSWKNHFLFKILRNAGPEFKLYQISKLSVYQKKNI
jgi:hypothetical protein